ncbi:tandem-type lipoprotein [Macrococcus capreoli]|uniref:tandem-type lipoprotein n=1 Tax=Macrococcus capreoli TaxID=2982690 RepID=UPI0021D5CA85|nr:tandem-type lipoprotein [Macrococcus sp. TMW 2.2395]MCU7558165.1 tandem-type lipoprotein [Macrococcus sp. TMW 2.2395]
MKKYKKGLLIFTFLMIVLIASAIIIPKNINPKIEQAFEKHLSIYPVKRLEDFYDLEGFRDKEFDQKDKGTWVLESSFTKAFKYKGPVITHKIVLYLDRNKKTGEGQYSYNLDYHELGGYEQHTYNVELKNNHLYIINRADDLEKKFVENFRFLVQDKKFEQLNKYKLIKTNYIPTVPKYSSVYQLDKNNEINRWVQNRYHMAPKAATLYLEGLVILKEIVAGISFLKLDTVTRKTIILEKGSITDHQMSNNRKHNHNFEHLLNIVNEVNK